VDGKAVVTHYTQPEQGPIGGLRIGDVIEAMDGKSVKALVTAWSPYYPASNEPTRLRDIASTLTQGDCTPCRVQGKRLGVDFEVTLNRLRLSELDLEKGTTHDLSGETFRLLTDEIAYLKLSSVVAAKTADYVRAATGTRGLIVDIRNYPSEFVVFALGKHLVAKRTEFVRFTTGDLVNPGAFTWGKPLSLTPAEPRYTGRIAILVDESTQSSAEYTTMAFRSVPGAVVVGSTTAGADGDISRFPFPGRVQGAISGIGVFYPDKTPTQRVGIVADLKVQPTVEGIRDGRDEVLEAAMAHLLGRKLTTAETERLARER
jgi:C-terminal processing protease CtpA/Prc